MKTIQALVVVLSLVTITVSIGAAGDLQAGTRSAGLTAGRPSIQSMSALAFGPEGILFIGDGKGGAVYAVDVDDRTARDTNDKLAIENIEEKIAALLGARSDQVMIHDLAVNPISQNVYLAVSRGRSKWDSGWLLPNDIAAADILLRITPDTKIEEVSLEKVRHARAALPNPVEPARKHKWKKGVSLRAETITDMAYADGTLYVAGLSNEEFASTMWKMPYPFEKSAAATTLEIFHGAHGKYETHAPIRTFLPYSLNDEQHLLAAYLCTPLVTFRVSDLTDGRHVKGRTVGEFGSGNYPLDMVVYRKDGRDRLLIANSSLPLMIVDPRDLERFQGSITKEVEGYTAGVPYEIRSGAGIQQMDMLNEENIVALQRLPGGTMNLISYPVARL